MPDVRDRFRGCLLGSMIGDMVGAVVEAESPQFIAKRYRSIDEILAEENVEEFSGPDWVVGRFTDDTQMTICVAEWLLANEAPAGDLLLGRFAAAYEPWRRYGPGTARILETFPHHRDRWRQLSTMAFPHGSYGNGSAMRVAPIGLAYCREPDRIRPLAIESSRPTHSHPFAFQGAALQAIAVATAVTVPEADPVAYLRRMRECLAYFSGLMQHTSKFTAALGVVEQGLERGSSCLDIAAMLGTGIEAFEAVPMALYFFLRHPHSFVDAIHQAVFIGGDTDTIASMTGALSGAFLGRDAVPPSWLGRVREEQYDPAALEDLADRMFKQFGRAGI